MVRERKGDGAALKPERVQKRLTVGEARERLGRLPAWELAPDGRSISRTVRFPSLALTVAFLNLLAALAELSPGAVPELELEGGALTLHFGSTRKGLFAHELELAEALEGGVSLAGLGGARR